MTTPEKIVYFLTKQNFSLADILVFIVFAIRLDFPAIIFAWFAWSLLQNFTRGILFDKTFQYIMQHMWKKAMSEFKKNKK